MSTRLAIDEHNDLKEVRYPIVSAWPKPLRFIARVVSWIFHPVFIPVYVVAFLVYIHPYLFAGFSGWNRSKVMLQAILMFTFFPIVTVLLLKGLKFIQSIFLYTQKDRIIPYAACMIWYFWIWNVWHNLADYPPQAVQFAMGIFLASVAGLLLNIYMKVSMHALSMGVVATFIMGLALNADIPFGLYASIALLLAGLVCTARFIISDHNPREIWLGVFGGMLAQLLANWLA